MGKQSSLARYKGCWVVTGLLCLISVNARALDIADFLDPELDRAWRLAGLGNYGTDPFRVTGSARMQTSVLTLALEGPGFEMEQCLALGLADGVLLLDSCDASIKAGNHTYEKENIFMAPAGILPREVDLGCDYDYTANTVEGDLPGKTRVGSISFVETRNHQGAETMEVECFAGEDITLVFHLARNLGIMRVVVIGEVDQKRLYVDVEFSSVMYPWPAQPVEVLWKDTCKANLGTKDGLRTCEWLGTFWVLDMNSPWICHAGLGWLYCSGDKDSLYAYVDGAGWLWTRKNMYPIFYSFNRGGYLYYVDVPGSNLIWNYNNEDWENLVG
jgi:hypothetical protein